MRKFKKGLVSIILPTHNRADMLNRAIESIFSQSYKNMEIVIIANGCIDNTIEVVDSLKRVYSNIVFLNFTESLGGAEARNQGLDVANGEFIAFLDDDDEWMYNKIEKQIKILDTGNCCIVGCCYNEVHENKNKNKIRNLKENISFLDMSYDNVLGSYTFCMTKMEYINSLRIDKFLKANQDYDLWLKILDYSSLDAYIIQDVLANYYEHDNKISTNIKNKLEAQERFILLWKHKFSESALAYQSMKIYFLRYLTDHKHMNYLQKFPFIIKSILNSPEKYNVKKYYIYLNLFRYL